MASSIKYYVLIPGAGSDFATKLYMVNTPKKNSNGKYNVTAQKLNYGPMIVPVECEENTISSKGFDIYYSGVKKGSKIESGVSIRDLVSSYQSEKKYCIKLKISISDFFVMLSKVSAKYSPNGGVRKSLEEDGYFANAIEYFMTIFDKRYLCFLDYINNNSKLVLYKHEKGKWDVSIDAYYDQVVSNVVGIVAGKSKEQHFKSSASSESGIPWFRKLPRILGSSTRSGLYGYLTFILRFDTNVIDEANEWEIGSIPDAHNNNGWNTDEYCFYCSDNFKLEYLRYMTDHLPLQQKENSSKVHSQSTHSKKSEEKTTNTSDVSTVSSVSYSSAASVVGDASKSNAKPVQSNETYKIGEYADSTALCPILVIQLLGSDSENAPSYNLTIPYTSTFVSLTHQRSLHDGYNKFTMQLFDQDAMQVEAKLLLGFRYVKFYYTDQTSRSKTFQGAIMDYKNVITGKGLMLSIEGYTTSTNIYTEKDSVPWSKIYDVQDYAFFYWLNNEGEYQGEVRMAPITDTEVNWEMEDYKNDRLVAYNGSAGSMIPAVTLKNQRPDMYDWITDGKSCEYSMQVQDGSKLVWETFDKFYENVEESVRNKYRPHPQVYSLEKYNEFISNNVSELFLDSLKNKDVFEKRPSNVVKMICAIMKWKTKPSYILTTKEVEQIPDQTSKSFVQYILEDLIPMSVSNYDNTTQYAFWFDNEGYAHYQPKKIEESRKSLYFNAPNKEDSYPLISFTNAVNGSVLMNAYGQQTVEALNYFTGEELNYTGIKLAQGESDVPTTIYKSEEWYETSSVIGKNKLVSYTNTSTVPSESELKKLLVYKYGAISQYTYKASLEIWGAFDLEAGQSIDIYVYLDEGKRQEGLVTEDQYVFDVPTWSRDENGNTQTSYTASLHTVGKNITLHHSSGTYFINKITDTISGGRFITQLECIKVSSEKIQSFEEVDEEYELFQIEKKEYIEQLNKEKQIKEDLEKIDKWVADFEVLNNRTS